MAVAELTDDEIKAAVGEHGSVAAAARTLGVSDSTLRDRVRNHGLSPVASLRPRRGGERPKLTRASVEAAMLPPNNCRVKAFRDTLDEEATDALDYALAQDKRDLSSTGVRDMLLAAGFAEPEIPGTDAINSHRKGERPCRCKG